MLEKIITFISTPQSRDFEQPKPAKCFIPTWYKEMNKTADSEFPQIKSDGDMNTTVKACMPFLDSISLGYMFTLQSDVQITLDRSQSEVHLRWGDETKTLVTNHNTAQYPEKGIENHNIKIPFKWQFPFIVSTPKGYSTMFTHPFNRYDLPFQTFTGIVETDEYPAEINFPFVLTLPENKDFLIIEAGTPLCQIIPFKRENWCAESDSICEKDRQSRINKVKRIIQDSYKKQWFKKKKFR